MKDQTPWTLEDVPVCNCAGCFRLLMGRALTPKRRAEVNELRRKHPDELPGAFCVIAGRINGRPYCCTCLESKRPATLTGFNGRRVNDKYTADNDPSRDNATRAMEGD